MINIHSYAKSVIKQVSKNKNVHDGSKTSKHVHQNKQKIDFKMLGMYSIAITALIGFGIHPYISKKNKKTE